MILIPRAALKSKKCPQNRLNHSLHTHVLKKSKVTL